MRSLDHLPCDVVAKELMPAVRAALAITLVKQHGLTIYRTAKLLGVAPAAVSNYLTARRSSKPLVDRLLNDERYSRYVREYSLKIVSGEMSVNDLMCLLCKLYRV
ncbi:MAG: hypothetical protein QW772_04150 [Zestosphaera sp.]